MCISGFCLQDFSSWQKKREVAQKAEVVWMPWNPPGRTHVLFQNKKDSGYAAKKKKKRNLLLVTVLVSVQLVYSVSGCVVAASSVVSEGVATTVISSGF